MKSHKVYRLGAFLKKKQLVFLKEERARAAVGPLWLE